MLRAMIVDDERITRETLCQHIPWKSLGFESVQQAPNGAYALEMIRRTAPDLILCDIRMPVMDGIELGRRIRDLHPDCKLIYLSAYTEKDYLKSAIQLSAVDFIEKPLVLDEIIRVVKRAASSCNAENRRKQEHLALLGQRLAVDLCSPSPAEAKWKSSLQTLGFPVDGEYRTVLARFNLASAKGMDGKLARRAALTDRLTAFFADSGFSVLSGMIDRDLAVFHFHPERPGAGPSLIPRLQAFCAGQPDEPSETFLAVGDRVQGGANLHLSYETAAGLLDRLFYAGFGSVADRTTTGDHAYKFEEGIADDLGRCLKQNRREEALRKIETILEKIAAHEATPVNYVKNEFYRIVAEWNRIMEDFKRSPEQSPSGSSHERKFIWEQMFVLPTLAELGQFVVNWMTAAFDQLNDGMETPGIAAEIERFILDHLQNEELSVHYIARHFFLTPNYISFLFKKESRTTIHQFITRSRLERAKMMLRQKKYKQNEIASKIGYSDPKYFARVFKREFGMTLSEYRERNRT